MKAFDHSPPSTSANGSMSTQPGRPGKPPRGTGGQFSVQDEEYSNFSRSKRHCGAFENASNDNALHIHLRTFLEPKALVKSGSKCAWCRELAYTRCTLCQVPLHNFPTKGKHIGKTCSVEWHNANNFGLAFADSKTLRSKIGVNWHLPSEAAKKANKSHIEFIALRLDNPENSPMI